MRLVAVSVVKNEADIIEPFVRHTLAWTDHHLVLDHDSTDGTRAILQALQAEGLPLTLYADNRLGNLQQARSNHLSRIAVQEHMADWVLPLDADEILSGPGGRTELENILARFGDQQPVSLPLLDYCSTPEDNAEEVNPLLRLRHARASLSSTRKVIMPRRLVLEEGVIAGKGSHAVFRGSTSLPDRPLPTHWHLAHLALRSPQHQVLRVILAELQKVSRGQAAAGLDVHYRFGYQLLAEDPALFFATLTQPAARLRLQPVAYLGGPLRHTLAQGWTRVVRALLPYLDHLAASHGRLLDAAAGDPASPSGFETSQVRLLPPHENVAAAPSFHDSFEGFAAISGWGPLEGPVPEAFLPPFHWGYAPATSLALDASEPQSVRLVADLLTYSESQHVAVELNGAAVTRLDFSRTNQRERLVVPLRLRPGRNEVVLRYGTSLVTAHDPRALAVIYLRLSISRCAGI